MSLGIDKGIGRWRVKNKGLWGVIHRDGVWTAIPQTKTGIAVGKQIIIMDWALGSWRVYLGGWGTYHGTVGIGVAYGAC